MFPVWLNVIKHLTGRRLIPTVRNSLKNKRSPTQLSRIVQTMFTLVKTKLVNKYRLTQEWLSFERIADYQSRDRFCCFEEQLVNIVFICFKRKWYRDITICCSNEREMGWEIVCVWEREGMTGEERRGKERQLLEKRDKRRNEEMDFTMSRDKL